MPRILREDGPDRIFHLSARVNWKAWHLDEDDSKELLAELVRSAATEFRLSIWGCALMSNHFHAVAQSPPSDVYRKLTSKRTACRHLRPWPKGHQKSSVIAQFMRRVRRTTSVIRQKQLELSGRFWEGAYDARPVEDGLSLRIRIAYDHRNPVQAGMVATPEDYPWSTAQEWATGNPGPVPLSLPETPPFNLDLEEFRTRLLRSQRARELDSLGSELEHMLASRRGVDPDALRELLRKCGLS